MNYEEGKREAAYQKVIDNPDAYMDTYLEEDSNWHDFKDWLFSDAEESILADFFGEMIDTEHGQEMICEWLFQEESNAFRKHIFNRFLSYEKNEERFVEWVLNNYDIDVHD